MHNIRLIVIISENIIMNYNNIIKLKHFAIIIITWYFLLIPVDVCNKF